MLSMIKKINKFKIEALLILFGVVLVLAVSYINNKLELNRYFKQVNNDLTQLLILDHKINDTIAIETKLIQMDDLNNYIKQSHHIIDRFIQNDTINYLSKSFTTNIDLLKKKLVQKELNVERIKFRLGFEFNIRSYLLDSNDKKFSRLPIDLKNKINKIRIEILNNVQQQRVIKEYENYVKLLPFTQEDLSNRYVKNFIKKIYAFHKSIIQKQKYLQAIEELYFKEQIEITQESLFKAIQKVHSQQQTIDFILIFIIAILLVLLYRYNQNMKKVQQNLTAFKTAVENSYNVIAITDVNRNIIFVNHMFEKVTGYTKKEAIGNNPRVLKSGRQDENFYKEMNETLDKGEHWSGRFINKDKYGNLFYEDATIAPIYNDEEIDGYLAIKKDVTQNVLFEEELKKLNGKLLEQNKAKEQLLIEQTKLATLGEMMDAVAHQWKQPLNIINSFAGSMQVQNQMGTLDEQTIENSTINISKQVHHLAVTLDEFRKFFRANESKERVNIKNIILNVLDLQKTIIDANKIDIMLNCSDDIEFELISTEFKHIFINLINNAKDAFVENQIESRYITINVVLEKENQLKIEVIDSAGGIPEEIINKIFESNFTTKGEGKGTGAGLYMTKRFIEKVDGSIGVQNIEYIHFDTLQKGAQFTLSFVN